MKLRFLYRAYKARYRDQRSEIATVLSVLRSGDVAVDVGSNKGAYLHWLRQAVGKAGVVHAFEPQPSLAAYLESIGRVMGWQNLSVHECALADHAGMARLNVPGDGVSPGASLSDQVTKNGQGHSFDCVVDTLDARLADGKRIALLKVDVEGFELQVFRGAERILGEHSPVLLFECEDRHLTEHKTGDVFLFLKEHGYTGSFFTTDGLRPVEEFVTEVHQRRRSGRYWDESDYFNNFFFKPTTGLPDEMA